MIFLLFEFAVVLIPEELSLLYPPNSMQHLLKQLSYGIQSNRTGYISKVFFKYYSPLISELVSDAKTYQKPLKMKINNSINTRSNVSSKLVTDAFLFLKPFCSLAIRPSFSKLWRYKIILDLIVLYRLIKWVTGFYSWLQLGESTFQCLEKNHSVNDFLKIFLKHLKMHKRML